MTLSTVAVLRPGDWVLYDGSEHQVLALAGTSVRLRTVDGADSVVLAGHLMASPGFAVVDSEPAPSVEPFALLDSLPGAVLDTAREWERHVVEIETGLPPGAEPGAPKPEYDPTSTTVVDRDRAAWRVKVIGRLPGEASCLILVWAVLDCASRGWRGMTMAPTGTRLLNDIRHQLLDPPTPLRPTDTTKITGAAKLSEPSPNMTTEEPSRSSSTPTLGRNPF